MTAPAKAHDLQAHRALGEAERLLQHYLHTAFAAAGLVWNEDNDAEVGTIVDNLARFVEVEVAHRLEAGAS